MDQVVIWITLAVLAILVALMFGALVELQRQLIQVRELAGFVDDSRHLKINLSGSLDDIAARVPELDRTALGNRSVIFVLSTSCSTCEDMAEALSQTRSTGWVAFIQASSSEEAATWIRRFDADLGPNFVFDDGGQVAAYLGVNVTPAAIRFEGDNPVSAATVPSIRQLQNNLDWTPARKSAANSK